MGATLISIQRDGREWGYAVDIYKDGSQPEPWPVGLNGYEKTRESVLWWVLHRAALYNQPIFSLAINGKPFPLEEAVAIANKFAEQHNLGHTISDMATLRVATPEDAAEALETLQGFYARLEQEARQPGNGKRNRVMLRGVLAGNIYRAKQQLGLDRTDST